MVSTIVGLDGPTCYRPLLMFRTGWNLSLLLLDVLIFQIFFEYSAQFFSQAFNSLPASLPCQVRAHQLVLPPCEVVIKAVSEYVSSIKDLGNLDAIARDVFKQSQVSPLASLVAAAD